jgi:DNA modification methylase
LFALTGFGIRPVGKWKVAQGDCLAVLKTAPDNFFDAMVSDPPAGIGFMNLEFDSDKGGRDQWVAWLEEVMREAMRTLKPGAHALIWAIPRTSHWAATAIENAGMEIREICHHIHGQGFPKSMDISKAIDKMAGAEREVVGRSPRHGGGTNLVYGEGMGDGNIPMLTAPSTDEAKTWSGWGTAMKPAVEHWILCRKPLAASSIARNVLTHGTGALNIAGTRVGTDDTRSPSGKRPDNGWGMAEGVLAGSPCGRWPPNLLLSHSADCTDECAADCPVAELDRQSGVTSSKRALNRRGVTTGTSIGGYSAYGTCAPQEAMSGHNDSGGASRFFPTFRYQAKPARGEKEAGLDALPVSTLNRVNPGGLENEPRFAPVQVRNNHPCCKSISLMRWLCKLITPPGGAVLDPFAGSGTTGCAALLEGFDFFGIEQDPHYCEIARARLTHWAAQK